MEDNTQLYIVGRVLDYNDNDGSVYWAFLGVYDDIKTAESKCTQVVDFVGPANLNIPISGTAEWPGAYYPAYYPLTKKD